MGIIRRANIADSGRSSDIVSPGQRRQVGIRESGDKNIQITERTGRLNKLYGQGIYGNGPYGGVN